MFTPLDIHIQSKNVSEPCPGQACARSFQSKRPVGEGSSHSPLF